MMVALLLRCLLFALTLQLALACSCAVTNETVVVRICRHHFAARVKVIGVTEENESKESRESEAPGVAGEHQPPPPRRFNRKPENGTHSNLPPKPTTHSSTKNETFSFGQRTVYSNRNYTHPNKTTYRNKTIYRNRTESSANHTRNNTLPPSLRRIHTVDEITYKLHVIKLYRGDINGTTVVVHTPGQSAACGVRLQMDSEYFLFAEPNRRGRLSTALCMGNSPWELVDDETKQNLEQFDAKKCH